MADENHPARRLEFCFDPCPTAPAARRDAGSAAVDPVAEGVTSARAGGSPRAAADGTGFRARDRVRVTRVGLDDDEPRAIIHLAVPSCNLYGRTPFDRRFDCRSDRPCRTRRAAEDTPGPPGVECGPERRPAANGPGAGGWIHHEDGAAVARGAVALRDDVTGTDSDAGDDEEERRAASDRFDADGGGDDDNDDEDDPLRPAELATYRCMHLLGKVPFVSRPCRTAAWLRGKPPLHAAPCTRLRPSPCIQTPHPTHLQLCGMGPMLTALNPKPCTLHPTP